MKHHIVPRLRTLLIEMSNLLTELENAEDPDTSQCGIKKTTHGLMPRWKPTELTAILRHVRNNHDLYKAYNNAADELGRTYLAVKTKARASLYKEIQLIIENRKQRRGQLKKDEEYMISQRQKEDRPESGTKCDTCNNILKPSEKGMCTECIDIEGDE